MTATDYDKTILPNSNSSYNEDIRMSLCAHAVVLVVLAGAVAAEAEMGASYRNCSSDQPMEDCCLINISTLLCQEGCPDNFYNVTLDDAFGIDDQVEIFKKWKEEFNKGLIWLQLTSHHVTDPSVYSLCKLCDVACANCSGPGDAKCLSCVEGYKRNAATLGRCLKKGEPVKQSSGKVISSRSSSIFAIVVPVFMVLLIIVLLYHKSQQALRFCHRLKLKGLASDPHEEADLSLVFQPEQPIFCHDWHFCEDFGSCGGCLQGKQSDVVLVLPEDAVEGTRKVSGAVCTDLDKVHKVLGLAPNEHIMSPVVEYCSEPQVRFHQPVQVVLPHFLPLSWAEDAVNVYSVQRDARGEVAVAKLKLWHQGSSPDARPQGGQYYIHNDRVHIFTDHFTVFCCSVCLEECPLQPLVLDVWAKHRRDVDLVWEQEQGIESLVEIRLYIWIGSRYMIKDFRMGILLVDELANFKGMRSIDIKPIKVYGGEDTGVCLKAELDVPNQMAKMWRHCTLDNGEIKYPESVSLALGELVSCSSHCSLPYHLVEWQLINKAEVTPSDIMQCRVIVGYVTKDGVRVDEPRRVMMEVEIKKCSDLQGAIENGKSRSSSSLGSSTRSFEQDNISQSSMTMDSEETQLLKTQSRSSQRQKRGSRTSIASASSGEGFEPITSSVNISNVMTLNMVVSPSHDSPLPCRQDEQDERDEAGDEPYAVRASGGIQREVGRQGLNLEPPSVGVQESCSTGPSRCHDESV